MRIIQWNDSRLGNAATNVDNAASDWTLGTSWYRGNGPETRLTYHPEDLSNTVDLELSQPHGSVQLHRVGICPRRKRFRTLSILHTTTDGLKSNWNSQPDLPVQLVSKWHRRSLELWYKIHHLLWAGPSHGNLLLFLDIYTRNFFWKKNYGFENLKIPDPSLNFPEIWLVYNTIFKNHDF